MPYCEAPLLCIVRAAILDHGIVENEVIVVLV
jgi:hypothetical protein